MTQKQVLQETLTELKRLEKRIKDAIEEQTLYEDNISYYHKWAAVKRNAIDFKNQLSLITTNKYKDQ